MMLNNKLLAKYKLHGNLLNSVQIESKIIKSEMERNTEIVLSIIIKNRKYKLKILKQL